MQSPGNDSVRCSKYDLEPVLKNLAEKRMFNLLADSYLTVNFVNMIAGRKYLADYPPSTFSGRDARKFIMPCPQPYKRKTIRQSLFIVFKIRDPRLQYDQTYPGRAVFSVPIIENPVSQDAPSAVLCLNQRRRGSS